MKLLPTNRNSIQGAMTVKAYLLLGAFVIVAGFGLIGYGWHRTFGEKAKLERQVQEFEAERTRKTLETEQAKANAELVVARNQQAELLNQTRALTAALEKLITALNEVTETATSLRTNDAGRATAAHHDLVGQARRLYENELPTLPKTPEVIERLEATRRIELQVAETQGTASKPLPELAASVQTIAVWEENARQSLVRIQTHLTTIIKEAKIKYTPNPITTESPTLDEGMQRLAAIELAAYESKVEAAQTEGKSKAAELMADAEAKRIVEEARVKAQQIVDEATAKTTALERERQIRAANEVVTNAMVKAQVETKMDEAQRIALRQRASDASVKIKLAPYLTPGRYVPYVSGPREPLTFDPKPMSFSKLKSIGALEPTEKGLRAFVEVGMDRNNDRPHLSGEFKKTRWYQQSESLATAVELQRLMVELGPTLVDMGLLEP